MIRLTPSEVCALINEQMPNALIAFPWKDPPANAYVEPPPPLTPNSETATHSEDFASVNWFGKIYSFTRPQAEIVGALWRAWKDGNPFLAQQTLLNIADSDGMRLRDCFKGHPAWGSLIRHGPTCGGVMGTYRLVEPRNS